MQNLIKSIKRNKHLILSVLIVILGFLLFFPTKVITIDEHDYLNNAHLLINGDLKTDCNLNIPGQWPTNLGYCISKYNIGTSIFLIPAVLIDTNLVILTSLVIFSFSILVFYKLIIFYKLDKKLIYIFALFPPFIFFSRTLLSEIYSMSILLFIYYSLLNLKSFKYRILAPILIIISLYIRYTNIIPVGILAIYFLIYYLRQESFKDLVKKYWIIPIILGLGAITLFIFNHNYYGFFLRSGYYFSAEEGNIVPLQFPVVFFKYFLLVNIFYPFGLIFLFKSRIKHTKLFAVLFITLLLFYSIVKNESFPGKLSDIILGLRFLIPVYPFLILPYAGLINNFKNERVYKYLMYTIIILLICSSLLVNLLHYNFINK